MRILIKISLVLFFIAVSLVSFDYIKTRAAFPAKTFIGEVDVSYLSPQEALVKLKKLPIGESFTQLITLESDLARFSFPPQTLGIHALYKESIDAAFAATHKTIYLEALKDRLLKDRDIFPLVFSLDDAELRGFFEVLATKVETMSQDATIILYEDTLGYNIHPEVVGRTLDIGQSVIKFKQALLSGQKIIPLAIKYDFPRVREAELREAPPIHRLAAYTTYYGSHDSPNRIHNIKLVASWVNETLMMPGDEFSVVNSLGDVTPERGYKEAFVIVGGELVPLFGGGSCQIATTLYNAVALADLEVLQRKNHSIYFNIYPLGRDAGVYPGQLDMRFKNNTPHPILIKAIATNRRLSFRIYGTPTDKTVKFSPVSVFGRTKSGFKPMSLKSVINNNLAFRTTTTRTVFDKKGKKIKEENIYSYYRLHGNSSNVTVRRAEPR